MKLPHDLFKSNILYGHRDGNGSQIDHYPRLDRTMSDFCQDDLYDPGLYRSSRERVPSLEFTSSAEFERYHARCQEDVRLP